MDTNAYQEYTGTTNKIFTLYLLQQTNENYPNYSVSYKTIKE